MRKFFLGILVFFLALGIASYIRLSSSNEFILDSSSNEKDLEDLDSSKISLDILAEHNKESDCWVGYEGKVYDITSFLPKHPGSAAAIAPNCGTSEEFTKSFTKKHGTSKVSMLMKVGTLMGDFEVLGDI